MNYPWRSWAVWLSVVTLSITCVLTEDEQGVLFPRDEESGAGSSLDRFDSFFTGNHHFPSAPFRRPQSARPAGRYPIADFLQAIEPFFQPDQGDLSGNYFSANSGPLSFNDFYQPNGNLINNNNYEFLNNLNGRPPLRRPNRPPPVRQNPFKFPVDQSPLFGAADFGLVQRPTRPVQSGPSVLFQDHSDNFNPALLSPSAQSFDPSDSLATNNPSHEDDEASALQAVRSKCVYKNLAFNCGLSVSCLLSGGRGVPGLCGQRRSWVCCVPQSMINKPAFSLNDATTTSTTSTTTATPRTTTEVSTTTTRRVNAAAPDQLLYVPNRPWDLVNHFYPAGSGVNGIDNPLIPSRPSHFKRRGTTSNARPPVHAIHHPPKQHTAVRRLPQHQFHDQHCITIHSDPDFHCAPPVSLLLFSFAMMSRLYYYFDSFYGSNLTLTDRVRPDLSSRRPTVLH